MFTLMRNFGSSLFISLTVLVLIRSTTANYARMAENISAYNEVLAFPGLPAYWGLDTASGLAHLSGEIGRQAAMIGYVNAFTLMTLVAVCAVPLGFLMRRTAQA